tara:strand:+ start:24 stop:509 length:486 start_codon:yes stop_codon:yes gene_type:complete
MNALKIVCEHYDTEIIDKAKNVNKGIKLFCEKINEVEDKLDDIYDITQIGKILDNKEDFIIRYNEKKNDCKNREMTWKEYQEKTNKYKAILDKFVYSYDGEDYIDIDYEKFIEKYDYFKSFSRLFYECESFYKNKKYWSKETIKETEEQINEYQEELFYIL